VGGVRIGVAHLPGPGQSRALVPVLRPARWPVRGIVSVTDAGRVPGYQRQSGYGLDVSPGRPGPHRGRLRVVHGASGAGLMAAPAP
jgi:hypothetical protein